MRLRWTDAHDGSPAATAYRGAYLWGQVAFYDSVNGNGPGWVGYVHGHRVSGPCASADEAQRKVERAPRPEG